MADYYTKGCIVLTLSQEQIDWAVLVLKEASRRSYVIKDERASLTWSENITADHIHWADIVIGAGEDAFDFLIGQNGDILYVSNAFEFDIMSAARWLQSIILKFDLSRQFGFLYTLDCSKARADGYGGEAVLITKDNINIFDAGVWLKQHLID